MKTETEKLAEITAIIEEAQKEADSWDDHTMPEVYARQILAHTGVATTEDLLEALKEAQAALELSPCSCGYDFKCARCKGVDIAFKAIRKAEALKSDLSPTPTTADEITRLRARVEEIEDLRDWVLLYDDAIREGDQEEDG